MLPSKPITMLATLGGQPQIITFALDALLTQGIGVAEVRVLHLAPRNPRLQHALDILKEELNRARYAAIAYRPALVRMGSQPLEDIRDEADANGAWEFINQLITRLKSEQRSLHVCISGGRRILSLLTMSAANLHFGHQDVLWHMHTPDEIQRQARDGALMHLPPDSGFRLIRVPMMPWGAYFPGLRALTRPVVDDDVLARPRAALDAADRQRCEQVWAELTPRQAEVLTAFAEGLQPQEVAERLSISVKTVDTHKTAIFAECRIAWAMVEDEHLDYHFLAERFGRWRRK